MTFSWCTNGKAITKYINQDVTHSKLGYIFKLWMFIVIWICYMILLRHLLLIIFRLLGNICHNIIFKFGDIICKEYKCNTYFESGYSYCTAIILNHKFQILDKSLCHLHKYINIWNLWLSMIAVQWVTFRRLFDYFFVLWRLKLGYWHSLLR